MSGESTALQALAELEAALDRFIDAPLYPCSDVEIDELNRRWETMRRKQASVDHALIGQVDRRGLWAKHSCKNAPSYLRYVLRVSPGEARARVRAAERLGDRVTNTAEPLEPIYPTVAKAQAAGEISPAHAAVITTMIEKLPHEVAAEWDRFCERTLVDVARHTDPHQLARDAETLRYRLDQDGQYRDIDEQERRRYFDVHRRADGSMHFEGELAGEAAELLDTHLDALAKPAPAADGTPDPRTAGQRRHDALLSMLRLVMKAGLLPRAGGITTTILLHMSADTYATGTGTAVTGHGYGIPADVAKKWAGDEARIIAVLLSDTKRVEAYSSSHRIFTEQQRLAMLVRDFGCTFPLCDSTALHTQAHHITEFQESRRTTVDDGTLLCNDNHAHFEAMGWRCTTIDGVPWWVPPDWIDPKQTPIRKNKHDLL